MVFALLGSVDMAFSDGGSVPGKIFFGFACAVAVLIVVLSVSSRRKGCLVRLDDAGVTLFGGQTVSWSAISEVRDIRKKQILVFLPRDGAVLPMLSVGMLVRPHILEKRLTRRWGSPLVLAPRALDASADEIIDGVRRSSGRPGRLRLGLSSDWGKGRSS